MILALCLQKKLDIGMSFSLFSYEGIWSSGMILALGARIIENAPIILFFIENENIPSCNAESGSLLCCYTWKRMIELSEHENCRIFHFQKMNQEACFAVTWKRITESAEHEN